MKQNATLPHQYLLPGQIIFAEQPTRIYTVLGSCIAVAFHHPPTRISAICHAQLPQRKTNGSCADPCPVKCGTEIPSNCDFKYVTCCLEYMLADFSARGVPKSELTIKLFGGANVIPGQSKTKTVGASNIEIARRLIQENHLTLAAEDVGGESGRSLYFYSHTGTIYMKRHRQGKVLKKIIPNPTF